MSIDIRQSPKYSQFMQALGWQVEKAGKWNIFIKKFPLIGSLIKVQRITPPIPFKEIEKIAKKNRAFKVVIEFDKLLKSPKFPNNYKINKSAFLPTKTIIIDLNRPEKEIFASCSPEKRRAIRKAEKNKVVVKKVDDPKDFIWLKKHSLLEKFIFPFGSKKEILALSKAFGPNLCFLLSYPPCPSNSSGPSRSPRPLAGIFLLFHQKTAYYWLAASTNKGKKLSAPSLLVWEALKLAKKEGCTEFDFEGIYDERFPISSWKGFTKFKEGFGGREITYPPSLEKFRILVF